MVKKLFYGILISVIIIGFCLFFYWNKSQKHFETNLTYNISGCEEKKEEEYTKIKSGKEKVDVKIDEGFVELTHYLNYVCCAKIKVYLYSIETYPSYILIKLKEKNEGEMCRCICNYKIDMKISTMQKRKYKIQIYGIEYENTPSELLWEGEIST